MQRTPARMMGVVLLGLIGIGGVVPALADDKPVNLQVWTIRATTKNKDISGELKGIADQLKKQFKYTGFKLEKRGGGQAAIGKKFSTGLIGGYEVNITPKRRDGSRVQVQVEFLKAEKDRKVRVLNATVTLPAGQFQLFGGWKLNATDALIVAVSGR